MKLKIAVQKSGRLHDESIALLKAAGIRIENGEDKLLAAASNFPLEVLYLRNSDIPQYLNDGVTDLAIIGSNLVEETEHACNIIHPLGFSRCRLSIALPRQTEYEGRNWLNGRRIATSYPNSLRRWLTANNLDAEVHIISGSVEIAPNIGLADAICDLVSSGSTLFKNGLREVETLLESEACLVGSGTLPRDRQSIADELLFRLKAVLASRNSSYILMNVPNDRIGAVSRLLPGMKSPTVMPLVEPGWSSLHSVISDDDFWNVIGKLRENGAEGILVIPIDKMIL
ncbi:MAG: ATP phosphoribosyltransferase [Bacteroidales bacterium]|jgi:ATP phosphoribosyltransferase|nr:ATP phosphoribosyltransferase [Bacteroidales bacterium]